MRSLVSYSKKGQMKIQEMAFVLIAILILFVIIGIFYVKISLSNLKNNVADQRAEEANEIVRKISASPEFAYTASDCANCIDMDKVLALKNRTAYKDFWGFDYLQINVVYPNKTGECTRNNYPDCAYITLIKNSQNFGITRSAYVSLCRNEFSPNRYTRCDLGRIDVAGKNIENITK